MDIVLIAGLWLRQSIWADVARELANLGHRPLPVALPGVDDDSTTATLADQVAAAVSAMDGTDRPMIVGHSAACTLAWVVADQRPEMVDKVVLIGGFPASDGEAYASFFPTVDGVMPFPGWNPFEGADSVDLDQTARDELAQEAVPVPEGVAMGTVQLRDDRRFEIPLLLVCPEYTPDQARAWIEGGDVPELVHAAHVEFVDIESGHWPMITRAADLARILDAAATR